MKLWKYVKAYRFPAIVGFLFKIAEATLELMVPLVMAEIIDIGIATGDTQYILRRGAVLLALGIIGYLCALVCQYYASKTSQSVGTMIRKDMYHSVNNYDFKNLDNLTAPSLITRITNDVIQIQLAVAMTIRLTSRAPFLIIGSLVLAFMISGPLSMIFIVGGAGLAIIMGMITIISMPYFSAIQKKLDTISLIARENLNGIRVIRAFSNQKKEIQRFTKETKIQKDTQIKVGKIQALLNPLTYVIVNLAIILIIYSGGIQVNIGNLSQGEVIALVNYMNQILLALIVFTNVLTIYNKAGASYQRIQEVLDTKAAISDIGVVTTWQESTDVLKFDHVYFKYEKKDVLQDITFTMHAGETLGIIGGTGAGKTTLVSLIGRFYEASQGNIFIDGHPITDFSLFALRKYVGYVFQNASLLSGTIRDNMKIANANATDEEIFEALTIAQAKEFVEQLEQGLDTYIEQGGKNLSGGQKQRLTIARALVKKPKILILDDSASALDFATDAALRKALQSIEGMSIIIISQRTASIEHANRILVLSHGDIVGNDNHASLLDNCAIYREIYQSQQAKEGQ